MLTGARSHQFGNELPVKEKKPRKYDESHAQREVVKWLRERPNWLVMRMENAARRTMAQAMRDKALGMEPGAPDLVVMFHTFAFFLEMKSEAGRVSHEQGCLHKQLRVRGVSVMVGRGAAATINMLEQMEVCWSHNRQSERLCIGGLQEIIDKGNAGHG
jgi:hypothetical protein